MLSIMLVLLLSACASTSMEFQLAAGRRDFINGDYTQAFHKLMPLAAQGDVKAEYAVGYMYYYGYGVPVDTQSGLFWMQRAADRNYAPAQKALDLIRHPAPAQKYLEFNVQS